MPPMVLLGLVICSTSALIYCWFNGLLSGLLHVQARMIYLVLLPLTCLLPHHFRACQLFSTRFPFWSWSSLPLHTTLFPFLCATPHVLQCNIFTLLCSIHVGWCINSEPQQMLNFCSYTMFLLHDASTMWHDNRSWSLSWTSIEFLFQNFHLTLTCKKKTK